MKYLIILLFVSCAPTEKLLKTKSKSEVVKIEEKRFTRKQLPRRNEWKIYTLTAFVGLCIITNKE